MHVRNAPEELFCTQFPKLMPPTLISSDILDISEFRAPHRDIIIKPLYGLGAFGVIHLRPGDDNLSSIFEFFRRISTESLIIQRYLPEVRAGDKRIILIDGEVGAAVLRGPKDGEARANMHVGGRPGKTELATREHLICEAIGPILSERGLVFVGIDVIGDYLTEINVTSPTGMQEIDRFDGVNLAGQFWDAVERRLWVARWLGCGCLHSSGHCTSASPLLRPYGRRPIPAVPSEFLDQRLGETAPRLIPGITQ
jgi:glutathione synthase